MRILLVDDDEALMASLAERLIHQRYAVDIASDGESARSFIDLFSYDLILLDLGLPDGHGIEFCQQFRAAGYGNPLMILTAKESTAEKVRALDAGADDYVVKPFDFDELCARIRALLRRENQARPTVLSWGRLRLDPSTCDVTYNQQPVRLTPKELSLLELFLRNPHRVYSLGSIIDDLWSFEDPPGEDAVRTHIKGLRRKLSQCGAPKDVIKTVYGMGYRLNEGYSNEESAAVKQEGGTSQRTAVSRSDHSSGLPQGNRHQESDSRENDQALVHEQLVAACRRYFTSVDKQLTVIEQAAIALADHILSPELCQQSQTCAHKLAGSLGSFGIPEGSQLARKIEQQLMQAAVQIDAVVSSEAPLKLHAKAMSDIAARLKADVTILRQQVTPDKLATTVATLSALLPTSQQTPQPIITVISEDDALVQELRHAAVNSPLQMSSMAGSLTQAQAVIRQAAPEPHVPSSSLGSSHPSLWLVDADPTVIEHWRSHPEQAPLKSPLHTALSHPFQLAPIVMLTGSLTLEARAWLVKQGVTLIVPRETPAKGILTVAEGLIRAQMHQACVAIAYNDVEQLNLLEASLKPFGFQVQGFNRARSLWEWMTAAAVNREPSVSHVALNSSRVDVIILDIAVPDIDSTTLCRLIRADARFRSIPILFLAGHDDSQVRSSQQRLSALSAGANAFIPRDAAPSEIALWLRNLLE